MAKYLVILEAGLSGEKVGNREVTIDCSPDDLQYKIQKAKSDMYDFCQATLYSGEIFDKHPYVTVVQVLPL